MTVARLAPSPTGSLHIGNARTFLWAWLSARAQNGRIILRIEDLDTPRVKPGVVEKMLDDLRWLGLDWDAGPDSPDGTAYVQSLRREYYHQIHAQLVASGAIYPCVCTREDIAASQSAPHDGDSELRYAGTCRGRFQNADQAHTCSGRVPAWRVHVPPGNVEFVDLLHGPQHIDVQGSVGDFVIAKTPDYPAYQLAVVADDIAMGVTEVVRGDDLIPSTARQILLYRLLGAPLPRYGHVPLVVGTDGKRLAKRHGDARIATLREQGVCPRRLVALLARWSGLDAPERAAPRDLIPLWSWRKLNRNRIVLTEVKLHAAHLKH